MGEGGEIGYPEVSTAGSGEVGSYTLRMLLLAAAGSEGKKTGVASGEYWALNAPTVPERERRYCRCSASSPPGEGACGPSVTGPTRLYRRRSATAGRLVVETDEVWRW